jgi:hypothetical protein
LRVPGGPIAVRELKSTEGAESVYLELERPEEAQVDVPAEGLAAGDWTCGYRIKQGAVVVLEARAVGSDSLQAIINAISQLRARFARTGLKAVYDCAVDGIGLPDYLPQGFGPEFERHLQALVKREVEAEARALEEAHKRSGSR